MACSAGSRLLSKQFTFLVLALACAPLARAQEQAVSPAYLALLQRYAAGDHEAAIAEARAAWPENRLRDELRGLAALRAAATACAPCAARDLWHRTPIRPALLLHAETALAEARAGGSERLQLSAVVAFAQLAQEDPAHRDFARSVFETVAAVHQWDMRWGQALDWAERGLEIFPGAARLHLLVAAVEELQGAQVVEAPAERTFGADRHARAMRARMLAAQEARDHFARARAALARARSADPSLVEAYLRLGRVAWHVGDAEAARIELDAVLDARAPSPLAFLAHLFTGRLAEDDGRLAEAADCYRAALRLQPGSQSAGVALSHALHRAGDLDGARQALLAAMAEAGRRLAADPFWLYPTGFSRDAEDRLLALRGEVTP